MKDTQKSKENFIFDEIQKTVIFRAIWWSEWKLKFVNLGKSGENQENHHKFIFLVEFLLHGAEPLTCFRFFFNFHNIHIYENKISMLSFIKG